MSSFFEGAQLDLIALLQSNKIKERNDGLVKLEQFTSQLSTSSSRLTPALLLSVIDAIFKNILIETTLYTKSRLQLNYTIEERLQKCSRLMRSLILKVKDGNFKKKFKFKAYFSILKSIVSASFIKNEQGQDELFKPVCLDLLKTFHMLLMLSEFKLHLSSGDNLMFTSYLIKGLMLTVYDLQRMKNESSSMNEKVLVELLQSLNTLCFDTNYSPSNFLNGNDHFAKIIEFVLIYHRHVFLLNKKESLSLILIFRIINQMMIRLSINNIGFCYKLFRVGVRFFNGLKFITFDNLKEQLMIFINLAPLFISLDNIPKQEGDNWSLDPEYDSQITREKSTSLEPFLLASSNFCGSKEFTIPQDEKVYLSELITFIDQLFQLMLSSSNDYRLLTEDIHLKIIPETSNEKINWFNLRFMNFQREGESEKAWLLRYGLTSILVMFFRLKDDLHIKYGSTMMLHGKSLDLTNHRASKRRKTQISDDTSVAYYLTESNSVANFLLAVVKNMTNDLALISGLQILSFFLGSPFLPLNATKFSFQSIATDILATFELQDNSLNYWCLLCMKFLVLRSHYNETFLSGDQNLKSFHINQSLRYSLDMIKVSSLSEVSCSLICSVLELNQERDLKWKIDHLIMKQFEALIQLSEINGPSVLSGLTLYFWMRIFEHCKTLKIVKTVSSSTSFNVNINEKIQDWLFSKWSQLSERKSCSDLNVLSIFISWLSGAQNLVICKSSVKEHMHLYDGDLMHPCVQWLTYRSLRSFCLLNKDEGKTIGLGAQQFNLDNLQISHRKVDLLLTKIRKFGDELQMFHDNDHLHQKFLCHWIFALLQICEALQPHIGLAAYYNALWYQVVRLLEDEFCDRALRNSNSKSFIFFQLVSELTEVKSSVVKKFLEKVQTDNMIESALNHWDNEILQQQDERHNVERLSFRGFGDIKRASSHDQLATEEDCTSSYYELQYRDSAEHFLIGFVVNSGTIQGLDPEKILKKCCTLINKIKSNQRALKSLLSLLENEYIRKECLESFGESTVEQIFRLYADRLLANFEFERHELTMILGCRLLSTFRRHWCILKNEVFVQDCADIMMFLFKLIESNLVDKEQSASSFFCLLFSLSSEKENPFKLSDIISKSITVALKTSNNYILVSFVEEVTLYLRSQGSSNQAKIYNLLQELFPTPQKSVESAATYCYFIGNISRSSFSILASGIFNLIELANFRYIRPYLRYALIDFCEHYHVKDIKDLFRTFRLDIFKYWMSYGMEVTDFPFHLFEYNTYNDFLLDNYKELLALELINRNKPKISILQAALQLQNSSGIDVIVDSFSLIVSLAYSEKSIRSEIFVTLKNFLKSESVLTEQLQSQALLIIFEILKLCDVSNDDKLNEHLKMIPSTKYPSMSFTNANDTVYAQSHVSISCQIAYSAIETVVLKLYGQHVVFWNTPNVYFLVRKLLNSVEGSICASDKVASLRRIKFLMTFPRVNLLSLDILVLLVCELSRHLHEPEAGEEICSILIILWDDSLDMLKTEFHIPLFVTVLSRIINNSRTSTSSVSALIKWMRNFFEKQNISEPHSTLLRSSVDVAEGILPKITIDAIEEVLELEDYQYDYDNQNSLFRLIAALFSHCPYLNDVHSIGKSNSEIVAKKLMMQDTPYQEGFALWKARYLGMFYSRTGTLLVPGKSLVSDIQLKDYESNFDYNVSTLDRVFLEMARYDGQDFHISSCVEYLLGVILWRNENKDEDKLFLHYNQNFHKYEDTIMKLNFHTYILLIHDSENEKKILHTNNLSQTTNSLPSIVAGENSDIWMSILTLALTNELSHVTGLALVVSIFILKAPEVSKSLFNHLVMFYIHSIKGGGAQINNLITQFYLLNRLIVSSDCKSIFIDLVMLLKVGKKQGKREFVAAYSNLDFPAIYRDAIAIGLPQTALLIMENFFTDPPDNVYMRWQDEREFLTKVYDALDDSYDLVYGLPVQPTLEYGIGLINRGPEHSYRNILFNSGLFDTSLSTGSELPSINTMVGSTLSAGLNGFSKVIGESWFSDTSENENLDQSFEWAWKLNQWDIPVSRRDRNSTTENTIVYKTLKLMHDYPKSSQDICKESLCELVLNKRKFLSHKDQKEFTGKQESFLRSLALILNVENILHSKVDEVSLVDEQSSLSSIWYLKTEFEKFENILLGRKAAFEFLAGSSEVLSKLALEEAWIYVLYELTKYGDFARKSGESQKSINSSIYFNDIVKTKFGDSNNDIKEFVLKCAQFQIASTFWDQGETGFPVATLKEIIKRERVYQMTRTKSDDETLQKLPYLQMYLSAPFISAMVVKWSSESRQESSSSIMEKYLETISSEMVDSKTQQAEIYHHFATFCDKHLKDQSLNEEIAKYSNLIAMKEKELIKLREFRDDRRNTKEDRDAAKSKYARIYRIRAQDKEELARIVDDRNKFVVNATRFYLKCIAISDDYDDVDVDRFCGIWLEYSALEEMSDIVKESLSVISSHKFIAWVSQLMSRLADELNNFQYTLTKMLESMSYRHPYHTVYLIKSLRLHLNIANNDPTVESRALAAEKLWKKLALKNKTFTETVLTLVDDICEASSNLANERFEKASKIKLSGLRLGQFWLKTLPSYSLPPPTFEISVNKNGDYRDAPFIVQTDPSVSVATSGVSLPKIMTFKLSDGGYHKMLLKGGSDDLRQDAIMEQVFEKVNKLFQNYRETRERNLRIRTYKVVPLGPQAGLMEFVRNSIPLNDVLRPLHENQDKLKLEGARSLMKRVQKAGLNDRIKTYYSIMEKVKPVMRKFFYDNFLNPQDWFESKITYTRGISTTSFVGCILGLGDRHSNNILMDNMTGEPIHIDLGVAFDQGKRLPIPETVPFRLTRDIVDGFGVTGVEGCFIKTSEHVMRVLRFETERIMDILNILKYDPLYSWTLSPIRKQKLQEEGDMFTSEDIEATDAIEGVRKKLNLSDLSVEAAVRELTQEATDPNRLACIYMGWSPFY